jgi:hypothetical protein
MIPRGSMIPPVGRQLALSAVLLQMRWRGMKRCYYPPNNQVNERRR